MEEGEVMAATNTTTAKKATTTVAKPATTTAASPTTPAATSRTTTTSTAATNVSTGTASAATNMKSASPQSATQTPNGGLFSGLSLAGFLGLPAMIDYQDLAIRASLVVVGIVLFILVAWSFVQGKQSQNVTVQAPPAQQAAKSDVEAAEVAA